MKGTEKLSKGEASPSMMAQGLVYFVAGLWPLVSYASFKRFASPKAPPRLVQGFGAIVSVSGLLLIVAGLRSKRASAEPVPLAGSSIAGLTAVMEVLGSFRGSLSPITVATTALETIAAGLRQKDDARTRALTTEDAASEAEPAAAT
jgi:hypothetical protein